MSTWDGGGNGGNSKTTGVPPLTADATPLALGDWLAVIGPIMRDLTPVSDRWWTLTVMQAEMYYGRWKTATPLDRVGIKPAEHSELCEARYQRTAQRGAHLLLRALPEALQQSLIAERELGATTILYRLMTRFQPGEQVKKLSC